MANNQFFENKAKSIFRQTKLEYLGLIITQEGVKTEPKKVQAIINWPPPKNIIDVRRFLGATRFLYCFIRQYAHIVAPLSDLTKKDTFAWGKPMEKAFQTLKNAMITTLVHTTPTFSHPFTLECDALGLGVVGVLLQDHQPLAYKSCKLNVREQLKPIYDKEMSAIMHAMHQWRQYLLDSKFVVKTDHDSLKYFLTQENLLEEQRKWVGKLQTFDFDIVYKKGKENIMADSLSRITEHSSLQAIFVAIPNWIQELVQEYKANPTTQKILQ